MSYSSNNRSGGSNSVHDYRRGKPRNSRIRVDVNDTKVREVLDVLHKNLESKVNRGKRSAKDDYIMENKIFSILCSDIDAGPTKCAELFNAKYGTDITEDEVIRIFRSRKVSNPAERKEILKWATKVADLFAHAISGNKEKFE